MPNITLTTAISGKEFVIQHFLVGIRTILKANPSMGWLVCDTSGSESLKKRIHVWAEDAACPFVYTTFPHGPRYQEYANKNSLGPLIRYMPKLYNHMMSHVSKCDYVLNIEDDIVSKMEDPVPLLLGGFDVNTAAVVGVTFNRRLTGNFGNLQGHLKQIHAEGYSKVKRTPFGLIMMKYEYSQIGFSESFGAEKAFDNAFGAKVESLSKNIKIAWSVRTKHYFKTRDGFVDCVDDVHKPSFTMAGNIITDQYKFPSNR